MEKNLIQGSEEHSGNKK